MKEVPLDWQRVPDHPTRTALLQARRELQMPDLSYDLDGDGIVDGKDLLVAKQFDLAGTGKLTPAEQDV